MFLATTNVRPPRLAGKSRDGSESHPYRPLTMPLTRRPELIQHGFLCAPHCRGVSGRRVEMPMQVQKTVDDVPGEFSAHRFTVFRSLSCGGCRADDDFSVWERDHIRGPGHIEKFSVYPCDGAV